MTRNIFLISSFIFVLISCNESKKRSDLNELITDSLNSGKSVERVFMDLKFGMSKSDFENGLQKLMLNGKIKLHTYGYSYEFVKNPKLKKINWIITSNLHNDTLIGIDLHSFKNLWKGNYNSIDQTYREIVSEYSKKYGKPSYSLSEFENYWLQDNLLILITKDTTNDLGGSIYIKYKDKRRENSIELGKCKFDENGNSLDPWYFNLKERNRQINSDI